MNHEKIAEEIIGLNIKEAAKIVKNYGLKFHVAVSNGINLQTQAGFDPNVINVEVYNNEITEVIR